MNGKEKLLSTTVVVTLSIALLCSTAYISQLQRRFYNLQVYEGNQPTGFVEVWVKRAGSDTWEKWSEQHNIVVNIGLARVCDFHGWHNATGSSADTDDISLSANAGSPSASWTILPGEFAVATANLGRADGTVTRQNLTAYKIEYTWTANATQNDIHLTGLHWSATVQADNTMFAAAAFSTDVDLVANDQLKVTWTVNFQSG